MTDSSSEFSAVDKKAPIHPIDEQTQREQNDARPGVDDDDGPVVGVRAEGALEEDPISSGDERRLAGSRSDENTADMSEDDPARPADQ